MLGVSQVTIRKDLDVLEERGLLSREHGYAVMKNVDDINNRMAVRYDTKLKIAKEAAKSVVNGETIMIESGSSASWRSKLAADKKDVTIITNSAFIATYIREVSVGRVILLGRIPKGVTGHGRPPCQANVQGNFSLINCLWEPTVFCRKSVLPAVT